MLMGLRKLALTSIAPELRGDVRGMAVSFLSQRSASVGLFKTTRRHTYESIVRYMNTAGACAVR